jgi:hypothetical protein
MNVEKKPGSGLTFGHDLDSRAVGIREKPGSGKKAGSGLTFGHDLDNRAVGIREKLGSGLTFGHGLDSLVVRTSGHWSMPILDKSPLDVEKAEFVSECQT